MMYKRFIDRSDKQSLMQGSRQDFKLRTHGMPPKQVVFSFVALLFAIIIIVIHVGYKIADVTEVYSTAELVAALFSIGLISSGLVIFASVLIYKIHHIIHETEFQSLIFASSMRVNTEFCLIANADKTVVYCDTNFCNIFASFTEHTDDLKRLLSENGIKKQDKDKLLKAIMDCKAVRVPFLLTKSSGEKKRLTITVDPIGRPTGYSIVRGIKD
ncbi:MAG: hypothetical protein EB060_03135 [Proteobacteria bacterium]|nr:hypothetical protein [Pseudomonadota bacterium]